MKSPLQSIFPQTASSWSVGLLLVVASGCGGGSSWSFGGAELERPRAGISLPETANANWPGFRGVNGTGVSLAKNLPLTWDDRIGVRWSTLLPGSGNSSPTIWEENIFLTTSTEDRELLLLCLDRADGTIRWQHSAGHATGRRHAKNGDASSTPVTDGKRVFAFFGTAGMVCCDMRGNLLWQRSLGELDHPWGSAASPILFDDLVIQLCDSELHSSLVALDRYNGEIVWQMPRVSTGCWSTPAIMQYGEGNESRFSVVVNGTGCEITEEGFVIGYDPHDGTEQWRVQGTSDAGIPVPLVVGDMVLVASGRNGPTMLLRPTTGAEPTNASSDFRSNATCEVMWAVPNRGPHVPTGVVYNDRLYQIEDKGVLSCFDASTGEIVYEKRLPGNFTAGLIAGDGKIYATNEAGRTYIVQAGKTYQLLATNDLHGEVLSTPAVAAGDLFIRTNRRLYCIPAQLPEPSSVNEAAPFEENKQGQSESAKLHAMPDEATAAIEKKIGR